MKRSQQGFSVIELFVVLAIIGVVGFVGWRVWHVKKDAKPTTAAVVQRHTTAPTDEYAGWKTYTSKAEGFSFRYPADWSVSNILNPHDTSTKEAILLSAPHNFVLRYDVYKLNTNSNFNCTSCKFQGATQLSNVNYGKPLYMVVDSQTVNGQPFQVLGISDHNVRSQQPLQGWSNYPAKTNSGYVIRWAGDYEEYKPNGQLFYSTYNDFIMKPEVIAVQKVLKSLKY